MRFAEILKENWGRRGHPGYGSRIFSQGHYNWMIGKVNSVPDAQIKKFLIDWLGDLFAKDNPKLSIEKWTTAAESGRGSSATAKFEQRHFYYFAGEIKKIGDGEARKWVAHYMGELMSSVNAAFKMDRWMKECGVDA
jgi:hypothetical protein